MKPENRNDLCAALSEYDLWLYLGWQDIRLRYRRSKIGPLWITLSMTIFCLSLGVVYSKLFKADIVEYMPFLSVGFVVWWMISGMLLEFPNLYNDNASYLKDIKINLLTINFRFVTRHLIIFIHNAIIIIGIYFYFDINPGPEVFFAIPGLVLVILNLISIGVILSIFGTRFRDVAPITQSMVQVLFFITPLTWFPRLLPEGSWVTLVNPIAYYLDLTRSPLLGNTPQTASWLMASITLVLFSSLAYFLYRTKARRIPFWV